jgi:hypothetical protein
MALNYKNFIASGPRLHHPTHSSSQASYGAALDFGPWHHGEPYDFNFGGLY